MNIAKNLDNKKSSDDINEKALVVNKQRCPQDHLCPAIKVCPVGAISQQGFNAPDIDMDKCIKCGKCVQFCPMRALSLDNKK